MKLFHQLGRRSTAGIALLTAVATSASLIAGPLGGRSINRNININSNRSINSNRNVNVNRSLNVNRHVDVDVNHRYYHRGGGFVAAAVAGTIAGIAIGAAVAAPPRGYRTIYYGGAPYAYYGGVFYQPAPSGYIVVTPPVGATVPMLPPGAVVALVNGISYYSFEGYYYQPVIMSGVTQYRVVRF